MKYLKIFSFILMSYLLVTSCTEEIPLDLNNQEFQRLVVEGWFTNRAEAQTVELTLTSDYFANEEAPRAKGAKVSVTDGTQTFNLTETSDGIYQTASDVKGEIGKTYTLQIEYEGENYEASSTMNRIVEIDSLQYVMDEDFAEDEPEETDIYYLLMYVQEPPGKGDFYMWKTFVNEVDKTDTLYNAWFDRDDFVDGNYINGLEMDNVYFGMGDTVRFEMRGIPEETLDFFEAVMLETVWRGGPFDGPPANVSSNISNGGVGHFSAASVVDKTIVIEP
ncbi:MAG: DUF4249 domain-containing protein [Chitinophagales bacterium]